MSDEVKVDSGTRLEVPIEHANAISENYRIMATPSEDGAHRVYDVFMRGSSELICRIKFQQGDPRDLGFNGVITPVLLAIVKDHLASFQRGVLATDHTAEAISHIMGAESALATRSRDREKRGVLGSNEK